jgi:hypothetical protein
MSDDKPGQRFAFDEYKMYYDSTEKVTDRRLAMNSWNYGICTATIAAIAGLTAWAWPQAEFRLPAAVVDSSLAVMGIIFCTLWVRQIDDFKSLNNAKFDVLNAMAPRVAFGKEDDGRISATPFAKEWEILQRLEATRALETPHIVALRSSKIEYLVPNAFRLIFTGSILITGWVVFRNWEAFLRMAITQPSATGARP